MKPPLFSTLTLTLSVLTSLSAFARSDDSLDGALAQARAASGEASKQAQGYHADSVLLAQAKTAKPEWVLELEKEFGMTIDYPPASSDTDSSVIFYNGVISGFKIFGSIPRKSNPPRKEDVRAELAKALGRDKAAAAAPDSAPAKVEPPVELAIPTTARTSPPTDPNKFRVIFGDIGAENDVAKVGAEKVMETCGITVNEVKRKIISIPIDARGNYDMTKMAQWEIDSNTAALRIVGVGLKTLTIRIYDRGIDTNDPAAKADVLQFNNCLLAGAKPRR